MDTKKPRSVSASGLQLRRRLPTLPLAQYHRRDEAYLLCSEWEEVEPSCNSHLNIIYVFMTHKQAISALHSC